jgi:uncharacterized protein (DUF2147 family)
MNKTKLDPEELMTVSTPHNSCARENALQIRACAAVLVGIVCLFLSVGLVLAADEPKWSADDVLGYWETEHENKGWSRIEIYREGDRYYGKIVWLLKPLYAENDPEGMAGMPKIDRYNPDESLRDRPIIGLQIMRDFKYDKENRWKDGRIYHPKEGKTYRCQMTLKTIDSLEIYGYVKIGFIKLGKNATWTRVHSKSPTEDELGHARNSLPDNE